MLKSKRLRYAAAVLLSVAIVTLPTLSSASKTRPYRGYQQPPADLANLPEDLRQDHDRIRKLANHVQDRYRLPANQAATIVIEAFRNGSQHDLEPELILAIIAVESTFRERAISSKGAKGLMQVLAASHPEKVRQTGGPRALFDSSDNIRMGSQILANYLEEHGGELRKALARYNGSHKNPRSPFPDKVLRVYRELKQVP
jgi:soluble lytic murein transglycosylase-like protein